MGCAVRLHHNREHDVAQDHYAKKCLDEVDDNELLALAVVVYVQAFRGLPDWRAEHPAENREPAQPLAPELPEVRAEVLNLCLL